MTPIPPVQITAGGSFGKVHSKLGDGVESGSKRWKTPVIARESSISLNERNKPRVLITRS